MRASFAVSPALCVGPLLIAASLFACGSSDDNDDVDFPELAAGCQPLLAGTHCMLPYPSDFFLVDDESLPSGKRVAPQGAGQVTTDDAEVVELSTKYDLDGFSKLPLIVGSLPDALVADGLPGIFDDPASTLTAASPTILIDAESGEFIAHFTDLDPRAFDPNKRAIAIHPLRALTPEHRYIVALQGLKNEAGELAKAAEGFALLRDQRSNSVAAFDGLRERYESDIFPVLDSAGVERDGLQLAWDFTTGSEENVQGDMLAMREAALAWIEDNPASFSVAQVVEDPEGDELVWRRIRGVVTVPLFLDSDKPGGTIARDQNGAPTIAGTAEVPFAISIPASIKGKQVGSQALFFGHGFFGTRDEVDGGLTKRIADELETVIIGIDWWGMSNPDVIEVAGAISENPLNGLEFTDRLHQAMINWIVVIRGLEVLAALPELQHPEGGAIIDTTLPRTFLGISQGHILGGTLAAVSPDLERVMLNVGGAGLTHIMFRAGPFETFLSLLVSSFQRPIEQYAWVAHTQRVFDRVDPASYASHVLAEPFEGNAPRQIMLQMAIGDTSVPNFGTLLHARSLGVSDVANDGPELYGLPRAASADNGIGIYDFGIDPSFSEQPLFPTETNEVHNQLRVSEAPLEQMRLFLQTGKVEAVCDGVCDPT